MTMAWLSSPDRVLVAAAFVAGALALPWLPGPYLAGTPPLTAIALAFCLPLLALTMGASRVVFTARAAADDGPSRASRAAFASITTILCSLVLTLHVLVLVTLTTGAIGSSLPARAAVIVFGLHIATVGNVIPRLRPGAPLGVAVPLGDVRRLTWMRTHRAIGHLCVAMGATASVAGAGLSGAHVDAVMKVALLGATTHLVWSLRRIWTM
ncbi:MAG: hypothetical protein U0Q12_13860 [Vicinamibacterales bacterium]